MEENGRDPHTGTRAVAGDAQVAAFQRQTPIDVVIFRVTIIDAIVSYCVLH